MARRNICGAPTRKGRGGPCGKDAGWGTEHPGTGACKLHGGSTQSALVSSAQAEARKFGHPVPISPAQAIQAVLNSTAGDLAYATAKVLELDEEDVIGEDGLNPWLRVRERKLDQLADVAKKAADMGVSERLAGVAEAQTAMMGQLLEAVMAELGLTREQRKKLGPAIRKHTAVIEGKAEEKVAA